MNAKMILIALGASALFSAWIISGCDYEDPNDTGADGDTDADSDSDSDSDADGDSDTGPDPCSDVTGCGGALDGTWNVTASCLKVSGAVDMTPLGLGATCESTVVGELSVTGTWTVAGTSYTDATVTTGTETLELSADCKSISGTVTSCSRISGPLASAGYYSLDCVDNNTTGGCTCTAVIQQDGGMGAAPVPFARAEGNFTVDGSLITVSAGEQEYTYCVEGNAMNLTPVSTGLSGTVTGRVQLQKQ